MEFSKKCGSADQMNSLFILSAFNTIKRVDVLIIHSACGMENKRPVGLVSQCEFFIPILGQKSTRPCDSRNRRISTMSVTLIKFNAGFPIWVCKLAFQISSQEKI